jgi:hypothetical protein
VSSSSCAVVHIDLNFWLHVITIDLTEICFSFFLTFTGHTNIKMFHKMPLQVIL